MSDRDDREAMKKDMEMGEERVSQESSSKREKGVWELRDGEEERGEEGRGESREKDE